MHIPRPPPPPSISTRLHRYTSSFRSSFRLWNCQQTRARCDFGLHSRNVLLFSTPQMILSSRLCPWCLSVPGGRNERRNVGEINSTFQCIYLLGNSRDKFIAKLGVFFKLIVDGRHVKDVKFQNPTAYQNRHYFGMDYISHVQIFVYQKIA